MEPRPLAAITGASSGIGAMFARKLAADHDLLLIARRKDRLEQLASELSPARAEVLTADLAAEDGQKKVAERLDGDARLVLLVNNAGFGNKGRFWESSLASQEAMHQVHVMATMRLTHAALRGMVARDRGAIINVASVAAFVRSPGSVSYCATKSWIAVFTEALDLDLRSLGSRVTVQALCPGFTYSEFHDVVGLDRAKLAPKSFWLPADRVVDASLKGLRRKKLFVIPGGQYRLLTALITKMPSGMRVAFEGAIGRESRYK